jgi:hypothetical protein
VNQPQGQRYGAVATTPVCNVSSINRKASDTALWRPRHVQIEKKINIYIITWN